MHAFCLCVFVVFVFCFSPRLNQEIMQCRGLFDHASPICEVGKTVSTSQDDEGSFRRQLSNEIYADCSVHLPQSSPQNSTGTSKWVGSPEMVAVLGSLHLHLNRASSIHPIDRATAVCSPEANLDGETNLKIKAAASAAQAYLCAGPGNAAIFVVSEGSSLLQWEDRFSGTQQTWTYLTNSLRS